MAEGIITGPQMRAARSLIGMNQVTLAEKAGLSAATIKRMEGSQGFVAGTYFAVASAIDVLEKAGVVFTRGGAGLRSSPAA